jgi:hypothetical protein
METAPYRLRTWGITAISRSGQWSFLGPGHLPVSVVWEAEAGKNAIGIATQK